MALTVLRGLFVLLMAAVGWAFVTAEPEDLGAFESTWLGLAFSLSLGVLMVVLDIVSGRRKLAVFSGVAFGILVGLLVSYVLSFAVRLIVDNVLLPGGVNNPVNDALASYLNLLIGTISCYFAVSFVLQTKDDVRFIIPYIEFRRDTRGTKPIVVDTSALMDERLEKVLHAGFVDGRLVVPQSVVGELQLLADAPDRSRAGRARDGLDRLARLQKDDDAELRIFDDRVGHRGEGIDHVDDRVVDLAQQLEARVLSLDVNLAKVARLAGLRVLNLNELSDAARQPAQVGDTLTLRIERRGTGAGQGVAHLDDGTMVVVEDAGDRVGEGVEAVVTNTTQTGSGRMIFAQAKPADAAVAPPRGRRSRPREEVPATA